MLLGTLQICNEELRAEEIKEICDSLNDNSIRSLSLRGCKVHDDDFKRLMESLKECESLAQLNLNLGVCNGRHRIKWLSEALAVNKCLSSLFLHGTSLGDEGLECLMPALQAHPKLQSLDFGDCQLGDEGIRQICTLLPPSEGRQGLLDLTLSANPSISPQGWTQLAIAIAANSQLCFLYLDYNNIGDNEARVLSVALAASSTLERVDLEGCNIGEKGGEMFFTVLANYPTRMVELVLTETGISADLIGQINDCLNQKMQDSEEQESLDKSAEEEEKSKDAA